MLIDIICSVFAFILGRLAYMLAQAMAVKFGLVTAVAA